MNDFQAFADNYTTADFEKIRYDWNGKYGAEFHDKHYEFRMQLCEFLVPQITMTNIELVRDLYLETLKSAPATFSIYRNIHVFAQELLRRDWKKYLFDYMQAGLYGMDAYLGTGRIDIGGDKAKEILTYIIERLSLATDEAEKKLLNGYLHRFTWLAGKYDATIGN